MRIDQRHFSRAPDRDIFEESGQHRLAAFDARRHDHAVRFDAPQFARLQIGHDHDLAAEHLLRRVGFGDAGDDGARLRFADIDLHVQQLVGALDALGGLAPGPRADRPCAKSSIAILGDAGACGAPRAACVLPSMRGLLRRDLLFQFLHLSRWLP